MMAVQIQTVPWNAWWQKALTALPVVGWVVESKALEALDARSAVFSGRLGPDTDIADLDEVIGTNKNINLVAIEYVKIGMTREILMAIAFIALGIFGLLSGGLILSCAGVISLASSLFFIVNFFGEATKLSFYQRKVQSSNHVIGLEQEIVSLRRAAAAYWQRGNQDFSPV